MKAGADAIRNPALNDFAGLGLITPPALEIATRKDPDGRCGA
jgi:hypothetical protein